MKKRKGSFWVTVILFSLIGQVAWVVENMYFNVFIYNMFGASAEDISLMVGASSVAATLTTLLVGALSDKVGKRKIFITGGYILWGVSILGFSLVRTDVISAIFPTATSVSAICITIAIILDCVMTFFGSSANDACFNAWLTDVTEEKSRGAVEGVNAMMPLMAILVVFGGFMAFDLREQSSWVTIFMVIGIVVVIVGVLSIFLVKDDVKTVEGQDSSYFKNIIYGFRPSVIKANPVLYLTIIAFAVFGISIQVFMPYLILYYEVSLDMADYVFIMAPAIIIAGIVTAVYGRYYDKVGFVGSIIPSLISLSAGYVVLSIFIDTVLVFVGSLLMMIGYLTGMAVFGAMIRDNTPIGKVGVFQGLRIVGQVLIPGIIGPMIGAMLLANADTIVGSDGVTNFVPNQSIFVGALAVVVLVAVCVLVLNRVIKNKSREALDDTNSN
ncbi:MAG: MFS transporter [Clostridia bacterium]|nr:MFS transporter [Clostridia bacterium]